MASETIDYNAVLADLEAKEAAIRTAKEAIRAVISVGADQGIGSGGGISVERKEQQAEVRFDSFFGMSMPDAITKFLEMSKRPQSVSEMTKALQDGGFPTTAKNLIASVGSTLTRMKLAGDVVSVSGKWGMAAWYPALRRERIEAVQKGAKPKGKKTAKAKKPSGSTNQETHHPTADQVERIKALGAEGKKLSEIAKEVGLHHFVVMRVLKNRENTQDMAAKK